MSDVAEMKTLVSSLQLNQNALLEQISVLEKKQEEFVVPPAEKPSFKETHGDFTLRFAPRSFRRWSPFSVANSALGKLVDYIVFVN